VDICIYCKLPNKEPSAEHVVADALGGCIELRAGDVCKTCNGIFDQQIDRAVQDDLRPILSQLEVPGKRGTTTRWTPTETVDGEERRFNVTATEIVAADPRKLLQRQGTPIASGRLPATRLNEHDLKSRRAIPGARSGSRRSLSVHPRCPTSGSTTWRSRRLTGLDGPQRRA
jgi:HNH endonuclease